MNPNWTKIKVYTNAVQAEIVKQMLVENNIPAVVLNKQDSSYLFGVIELYVDNDHFAEAAALIDSYGEEDE
ncbi:putative signal transducing protein [Sphingobacterium lactis]|uniref:Putative signal transducing protein n=1 Tax=Sphingobacterium lactis TaxID=797291 RepID=A0A1H5ZRK3_9SPHI|nr:DUF2007 domain-containing protein [Sphingobacterium lactis]SEG38634.1 Putative signal transducing protein [Sphingobacterium lactis]